MTHMQEYLLRMQTQQLHKLNTELAVSITTTDPWNNKDGQSNKTLDHRFNKRNKMFRFVRSAEDPENEDLTAATV